MIGIKEETLQMALQKTGLRELPKALKPSDMQTFLSAIVLTKRINGIESYAYAENDGDGGINIKEDFGPCVRIQSIESIHPVKTIDRKILPDLRSDKQIVEYLCKSRYDKNEIEGLLSKDGKTIEQIKEDRAIIKGYISKQAIDFAKRKDAEESRVNEMKSYKSRVDNGEED